MHDVHEAESVFVSISMYFGNTINYERKLIDLSSLIAVRFKVLPFVVIKRSASGGGGKIKQCSQNLFNFILTIFDCVFCP
jgi:hypothetical protein